MPHFAGIALGSLAVIAVATTAALAEPAPRPGSTTGVGDAKRTPSASVTTPADKQSREKSQAAARKAKAEASRWSIKDALPEHSSAISSLSADPRANAPIGRLPVQSGWLGVETETKIKSTEYPDGQRAPGVDTNARQPPSYLGLSLSLPTGDKSMWPFSSK
jgi:hypothetical protein